MYKFIISIILLQGILSNFRDCVGVGGEKHVSGVIEINISLVYFHRQNLN